MTNTQNPEAADAQEAAFLAFQGSRRAMTSRQYGELVGDATWRDEPETQMLVYRDRWFIEICDDARHMLVLENQSWITGPENAGPENAGPENAGPETSLEDLERLLFEFSRDE